METIINTDMTDNSAIQQNGLFKAGHAHKILVVDDEIEILELLRYNLLNRQYKVITATNGEEALKLAVENQPDLILLDYMLPGLCGPDVATLLQQMGETTHIPIIFLTARADSDSIIKGLNTGANDYVTKPFHLAELMARIETQLKLKSTQDKLKKTEQELRKANASKDRFFSIFIHDIRTPIHAMGGFIQLLSKRFDRFSDQEKKNTLAICQQNADEVHMLLKKLMEWCRVQTGMFEYNPSHFYLKDLVDKTEGFFSAQLNRKKLSFRSDVDSSDRVYADIGMIDSVLRNLIQNAIRFTPNGGSINIACESDEQFERINISDTGVGMEPKTLENLFDIETQESMEDLEGQKGTGLGLVLCKELVEMNGGQIEVSSKSGHGATFSFTIPRFRIDADLESQLSQV